MDSIVLFDNRNLADDLEAIKDKAVKIVKLGVYKAAASLERPDLFPIPATAGNIEQLAKTYLTALSAADPNRAKHLRTKAMKFLQSPAAHRTKLLGSLSRIDLLSNRSVVQDARTLGLLGDARFASPISTMISHNRAALQPDFHTVLLRELGPNLSVLPTNPPAPVIHGNRELRFNLLSLKCIDPVDWEITDFANDRIAMGGLGADSLDQVVRVGQFIVGNFSVGERHFFNPVRRFVGFNLATPGAWPRAYVVTLAMAEKDAEGGFIEFLKGLWGIVKEVVKEIVTAAAIAAAGAIIGTAVEPGIGTLIGVVVGFVLGELMEAVFESLKDDLFEPEVQSLILPSISSLFPGNSKKSDVRTTEFRNATARYILRYQWELV